MEDALLTIVKARFDKEWDGTVTVPYLEQLISPSEQLNVKHMLPLESDTPYGNLQLSWMTVIDRIRLINETIDKINADFGDFMNYVNDPKDINTMLRDPNKMARQLINAELFVYLLKTLADRLIMLLSLIETRKDTGMYPERLRIDSLGAYLNADDSTFCDGCIDSYRDILEELNEVANSFKHTFLNLQASNIAAVNTPGVITFYQPRNNTQQQPSLSYLIFVNVVRQFDLFTLTARDYISNMGSLSSPRTGTASS